MSLISKLTEKFKNMNESTKKRLMALALAGTMAVSTGVGLAGCGTNTDPSTEPGTTITDPSGDTTTPGKTDDNNKEDNKYSKYSSILQKVLTDKYYSDLIADDLKLFSYGNSNTNDISYNSNKYKSIPYGFLENEGEDIDSIKNNNRHANSSVFTIGNNLYIEARIENISTPNYYTHYVLKYSVTNQELNELQKLFQNVQNVGSSKKTFMQAPFFIQELSYRKTPEVLSKTYISNSAIEDLEYGLAYERGGYIKMACKEFDTETLQVSYISCTPTSEIYSNCDTVFLIHEDLTILRETCGSFKVSSITIDTSGSTTTIDNKTVYNGSTNHKYDTIPKYNEFKNNIVKAYYYDCENACFENILNCTYLSDLEDYLID